VFLHQHVSLRAQRGLLRLVVGLYTLNSQLPHGLKGDWFQPFNLE
jgi:hypothetical protein